MFAQLLSSSPPREKKMENSRFLKQNLSITIKCFCLAIYTYPENYEKPEQVNILLEK